MNMWASVKFFTHDDLRKAFDEYAKAHGRDLANSALERSTGAQAVSDVPYRRILNAMVEFVGGYSFVATSAPGCARAAAQNLANIHASLAAIGEKAFAAARSPNRSISRDNHNAPTSQFQRSLVG